MTDTNQRPPKILNMAMCMPPQKLKGGVELLATFGVLMYPVCLKNLRLVREDGELKIWTSTPDMRFIAEARPVIIAAAQEVARQAIEDMEELAE